MKKTYTSFYFLFVCFFIGCVESFTPDVVKYEDLLVVDGLLTDQSSSSYVKLSRSYPLDSVNATPVMASVYLIENENTRIDLVQETNNPGTYKLPNNYQTTIGATYTLNIYMDDGESYTSNPVTLLQTPPIDSIYHEVKHRINKNNEDEKYVQLYLDSHDPQNKTWYYRWHWNEVYEVRPPNPSYYILEHYQIRERKENEMVDRCWVYNDNLSFLIASTDHLSEDVVSHKPLTAFNENSIKPRVMYSIEVEQYALSKEGYEFYKQLQSISGNMSSLFSPQPAQVTGNITHNQNPETLVLGLFEASTISRKRVFISARQIPEIIFRNDGFDDCTTRSVPPDSINFFYSTGYLLITPSNMGLMDPYQWVRFNMATSGCSDCRILGVNRKPTFWPD